MNPRFLIRFDAAVGIFARRIPCDFLEGVIQRVVPFDSFRFLQLLGHRQANRVLATQDSEVHVGVQSFIERREKEKAITSNRCRKLEKRGRLCDRNEINWG